MKHVLYHSFIACHNGRFDFVRETCKLYVLFHWAMVWEDDRTALQLVKYLKDDEAILLLGEQHQCKFPLLPGWRQNGLGAIYFDLSRYRQYVATEIMIIEELNSNAVVFNYWQKGTGWVLPCLCRSQRLWERHREVTDVNILTLYQTRSYTDASLSVTSFRRNWFKIKPEEQVPKNPCPGYWQKQGLTDHQRGFIFSVHVLCKFNTVLYFQSQNQDEKGFADSNFLLTFLTL